MSRRIPTKYRWVHFAVAIVLGLTPLSVLSDQVHAAGSICSTDGVPFAAANISQTYGIGSLTTTFTGYSDGCGDNVVSTVWDFGDGTSSSDATTTHTYGIGTWNAQFTVTDEAGLSSSRTYTISVRESNSAPVATPATIDYLADGRFVAIHLQDYVHDADGDVLTFTGVSSTLGGAHASPLTTSGDVTYYYYRLPFQDLTDIITYTAHDRYGASTTGTVQVNVQAPLGAVDDTATGNALSDITAPVLANDFSRITSQVTLANAWLDSGQSNLYGYVTYDAAAGTVTFRSMANSSGTAVVKYSISANGTWTVGSVTFTVNKVNTAPTAVADTVSVDEDSSVTFNPLLNDTDVDNDTLSVVSISQPSRGTATLNANGTITFTPDPNDTQAASLAYTISDGHGATSTGTIAIRVAPVNDAPVASFTLKQESNKLFAFTASASDIDNDTLTYAWSFGDGTSGSSPVATHEYTKRGTYTVTLTVTDGHGGKAVVTKSVTR